MDLSRGAHVLVHEANGSMPGAHTSPEEAAGVAARAEVDRLLLVHLPPGLTDADLREARRTFEATELGEELGSYGVSGAQPAAGCTAAQQPHGRSWRAARPAHSIE